MPYHQATFTDSQRLELLAAARCRLADPLGPECIRYGLEKTQRNVLKRAIYNLDNCQDGGASANVDLLLETCEEALKYLERQQPDWAEPEDMPAVVHKLRSVITETTKRIRRVKWEIAQKAEKRKD